MQSTYKTGYEINQNKLAALDLSTREQFMCPALIILNIV